MSEHEKSAVASRFLRERSEDRPRVGLVLGSGASRLTERIAEPRQEVPYSQIPNWPVGTVPGHAGRCVLGRWAGTPVAVLSGRVHLYEGFSAPETAFAVRVLGAMGVKTVVLTNAAGAINEHWTPPCLGLILDQINLQGANPLIGPHEEHLGPRFPDMTEIYDSGHRALARTAASSLGIELQEGVYAGVAGPSFETPAEIRFLRQIGADLVGMSTVCEAIAARQMGLRVLGISLVTNRAAGIGAERPSHDDVLNAGEALTGDLGRLLDQVIPSL